MGSPGASISRSRSVWPLGVLTLVAGAFEKVDTLSSSAKSARGLRVDPTVTADEIQPGWLTPAVFASLPADTTVVGIPARPVDRTLPRREAPFDPYGMPCEDALDPLLRDLEGMRAELAELEARVARITNPESRAPSRPHQSVAE